MFLRVRLARRRLGSGLGNEEGLMLKSGKLTTLCVGAVALAGCATGSSEEARAAVAAELAKYEKTGETDNCLPLRNIDSIKAIDDYNFLIEMRNGNYYLNELSSRCSNASDSFNRLQYRTTIASLCRNEIVSVVDNSTGFTVGSCGLSEFQEVTKSTEVASQ